MQLEALPLEALGWNETLQRHLDQVRSEQNDPTLSPGRVSIEHPGSYQVLGAEGPREAQLGGRLRHKATSRLDLPAVGDWIALAAGQRVEAVLPRTSCFVRKEAFKRSEPQVIAANINRAFVVTSANHDFNPRRIERYLSAVWDSGASPVLVVNKLDLCDDREVLLETLGPTRLGVPIACISALGRQGAEELAPYVRPRETIALVGSSGVGKSTISNWLLGYDALTTQGLSEHDGRGQHTTTHRQLVLLPSGASLIDTPGMREFGLWSADLGSAFADIETLGAACRFADCKHGSEPGCALRAALQAGELEPDRLESYFKLGREARFQELRRDQSARQAEKRRYKVITQANRQRYKDPGSKNSR